MGKKKDLTAIERDQIAKGLVRGESISAIARRLDRAKSTISEEVKRNSTFLKSIGAFEYIPSQAHQNNLKRRKDAGSINPRNNYRAIDYALDKLRSGWSPELIYGRVKIEYPDDSRYWMCPEAIYQLIYSKEYIKEHLWDNLPRKQRKRKRKSGRRVHKGHIPQRVSIHQRPVEATERKVLGHWEGDTVEGRSHKNGIHTEVERLSRLLLAKKVDTISSQDTITAQLELFKVLPKVACKSTTLDNGKENHKHFRLKEINMSTYFADPYSSWQRGSNEWHNGLLRRYFPKGTDFTKVSQEELDEVVFEINNRPRKVLQFRTPLEVFNLLLRS